MIDIDGSAGEGGGQIIRSSLALSLITQKPFRVRNIRAGRPKPGLQNQHLTSVRAAAQVGSADVSGVGVGAREFVFQPQTLQHGNYHFAIGTAGSTMLVLQTVLPALMMAGGASQLTLEGGTHNTHAPPFNFIEQTFVPLINKLGPHVEVSLERHGFYPPGGGRVKAKITPRRANTALNELVLEARGQTEVAAHALLVKLPDHVGQRELDLLEKEIPALRGNTRIERNADALSPGNVVVVTAKSEQLTETISAIGERGLPAEKVAQAAADEAKRYLAHDVSVGEHLADQLLIPMALAGRGSFLTLKPTLHTTTNIDIIQKFLDVRIDVDKVEKDVYRISFRGA